MIWPYIKYKMSKKYRKMILWSREKMAPDFQLSYIISVQSGSLHLALCACNINTFTSIQPYVCI